MTISSLRTGEMGSTASAGNICDVLVIAGGGGGGSGDGGGGGGAGGYRTFDKFGVASGVTYTVTIGAGGVADSSSTTITSGSNSVFSSISSTGGGRAGIGQDGTS